MKDEGRPLQLLAPWETCSCDKPGSYWPLGMQGVPRIAGGGPELILVLQGLFPDPPKGLGVGSVPEVNGVITSRETSRFFFLYLRDFTEKLRCSLNGAVVRIPCSVLLSIGEMSVQQPRVE